MKICFSFLMILFVCVSCLSENGGRTSAEVRTLQNVQALRIDLNGDKEEDSIILQIPRYWLDSGDFTRIVFEISGQKTHAFDNPEGWVTYDKYRDTAESLASLPGGNITDSRLLSLIKIDEKEFRVLLFGLPGAHEPAKLYVFSIINGSIKVDFYNPFQITQVTDLDGDRYPEVIGKSCYTRQFEDNLNFFSYSPYQVYSLQGGFVYNETLTEQFNRLSYFGYAGSHCSQDTIVVKTADSTVIMDLVKAKQVYSDL